MVSGALDFAVTAGVVLVSVLASFRLFSRLLLHRAWLNPYVRLAAVTLASVASGLVIAVGVLGQLA